MEKCFVQFIDLITLTPAQNEDAKTKYTGGCKKLCSVYYNGGYNDDKKYLFGSYKTKTNVRPLTKNQDVDVLFKIPQCVFDRYDNYNENGQSALLQEVRRILQDKYATTETIKAWGKVVLVQFDEGHHNVELLPALEKENGTFLIPNTEDGGSWEIFDPRAEIQRFNESNNSTNGLTRELTKIMKAWNHNTATMSYKSYKLLDDIIHFLDDCYPKGKNGSSYARIVFDFFDYAGRRCYDEKIKSCLDTAKQRASKAIEYEDNDKPRESSEQWRKIFGCIFPKVDSNPSVEDTSRNISTNPIRPWFG